MKEMDKRPSGSNLMALLSPAIGRPEARRVGVIRETLFRWLTQAVARVRRPSPDLLLDYLKPNGEVARYFMDGGVALLRSGEADAAEDILDRGARAYPEDFALVRAAASLAHERGRVSSAIAHWEAAARLAPDDPRIACELSASLRLGFQPTRASSVIEAALSRSPGDFDVVLEAARTATVRERHDRASLLWSEIVARGAPSLEAFKGKIEALEKLGDVTLAKDTANAARALFPDEGDFIAKAGATVQRRSAEALRASNDVARESDIPEMPISAIELMLEFESLGDNCEFGLAQRYCGADPLGLFRFSTSQAINLDHAFSTCFEEYGTDEDLILRLNPEDQEYLGSSRRYDDFRYHTDVCGPGVDEEALRKSELRKLAYLKKRLLSDLRSGEKIFVRKQGHVPDAMQLSRTIRAMGPNVFLWVEPSDAEHPVGHVEIVEPGLLRGYISKFAWYGNAHALELEDWLKICVNALGLAKGFRGQRVRYRLPDNTVLQSGSSWDIWPRCHLLRTTEIHFEGSAVEKLTLREDTVRANAIIAQQTIETPVSSKSLTVFSVWIWIPSTFRGTFVDVYVLNAPRCFLKPADLDKRDVWQRIYTSARMPKEQVRAMVALRVTGRAGDAVYVATWQMENGCVPNPWPRAPS